MSMIDNDDGTISIQNENFKSEENSQQQEEINNPGESLSNSFENSLNGYIDLLKPKKKNTPNTLISPSCFFSSPMLTKEHKNKNKRSKIPSNIKLQLNSLLIENKIDNNNNINNPSLLNIPMTNNLKTRNYSMNSKAFSSIQGNQKSLKDSKEYQIFINNYQKEILLKKIKDLINIDDVEDYKSQFRDRHVSLFGINELALKIKSNFKKSNIEIKQNNPNVDKQN